MAVARGSCPSCGAPIEFSVGSSIAKVCEYCKATVYRTDRGLEDLGKVAAIANVPSLIAVGDEGTISGRPFRVLGRVQLDHGAGPWDEYYVEYDRGGAWGFLAYAEGTWYATAPWVGAPSVPGFDDLRVEGDVPLGQAGVFRVAEVKTARVVSAEGEMPGKELPNAVRRYADLHGASDGFATLDYGDGTEPVQIFIGRRFAEREMRVQAIAPRAADRVRTATIRCPNCGGEVPKLSGERGLHLGCPYCGAVSDIAAQTVISRQEQTMQAPPIPIGAKGLLLGIEYTCIAYVQRSTEVDGGLFFWEELLLFSEGAGFRWLVKDETSWLVVTAVNLADLDLSTMPGTVRYGGRRFALRNRSTARVNYVLGELYWRAQVGETVLASDYTLGRTVLSREESPGEVRWSLSDPVPWPVLARAFNVPVASAGGSFTGAGGRTPQSIARIVTTIVVLIVLYSIMSQVGGVFFGGGGFGGPVYGGSGAYYGGK